MAAKKKKGGKASKKEKVEERGPENDPAVLFATYAAVCRTIGLQPHDSVRRALGNHEDPNCGKQILIEPGNDTAIRPLGPGGCRALALAILGGEGGSGNAAKDGKPSIYTAARELRFWRSDVGDFGAVALADMLRLGGVKLQVTLLELLGNGIGPKGAVALGRALSVGTNKSLVSLNLDFNIDIGSHGVSLLCRGIGTNSTLKTLSLQHCDIDEAGGQPIADMLSFSKLALKTLDLRGNRLGGVGLSTMSPGLAANKSLSTLLLSDNNILSEEEDISGLEAFASALAEHPSLTVVDIQYNPIGNEGGRRLLSFSSQNRRISSFKLDTNLDGELYKALFRGASKGGKKKKGGGKKSKKKKKKK